MLVSRCSCPFWPAAASRSAARHIAPIHHDVPRAVAIEIDLLEPGVGSFVLVLPAAVPLAPLPRLADPVARLAGETRQEAVGRLCGGGIEERPRRQQGAGAHELCHEACHLLSAARRAAKHCARARLGEAESARAAY